MFSDCTHCENIHPSIQGRTEQIQIKTGELICRGGVITFLCIFSSLSQIGSDLLSQVYFGRLSSFLSRKWDAVIQGRSCAEEAGLDGQTYKAQEFNISVSPFCTKGIYQGKFVVYGFNF